MAVKKIATMSRYTGAEGDSKPTGVQVGSTFWEYDTRILFITYDDGTNWEIKTSPPYEFTINGVNFDGHEKIKTLMLPSDCNSGTFKEFTHWLDGSEVNYFVPTGKVLIIFQALVYESNAAGIAVVGETTVAGTGPFTKEVLFLANGTALPSMENCWGVFAAGEYVTASSISYNFKSGSALYGVEVDA